MNRLRFTCLAVVVAAVTAASVAATGTAAVAAKGSAVTAKSQQTGTLQVRFAVESFVARGNALFAKGAVLASYASTDGTHVARTPFTAKVQSFKTRPAAARHVSRVNRICDVLELDLAPLRLELLGLIVELDRVHLTITADSEGGLLGALLCGLAGGNVTARDAAAQLTQAAQTSGLAQGAGFQVPLATGVQTQALPPVPQGHCTVLDLPIGPIHLNLLGLIVHLDRTQLRITADPNGGILGSLLCGLAGGPDNVANVTRVVPTS